MGADYFIKCPHCREEVNSFYITRNYNRMFPFWMLHNHIEGCYDNDKRKPFHPKEEWRFLCKTVRKTLYYYGVKNIYNHTKWENKLKHLQHCKDGEDADWYAVNKYTVIMALIRYYWHLRRYPFHKFKWSCWY
jgi:hypothetical protein